MRKVVYMDVIRLHECKRCGKTWYPRTPELPKICPTCKTPYWNTPRTKAVTNKMGSPAVYSTNDPEPRQVGEDAGTTPFRSTAI
jgi:hypothetical protein